jgi:membrane fusion protein (multidrug efflux system)
MRHLITPLHLIAAVSIAATAAGFWWWHSVRHVESTDDAYVGADIVPVSARLSGYVRTVDVADHQSVTAGTPLLTIDPADYRVAVARAQALVEARRASGARVDRELTLQEALIEAAAAKVGHAQAEERRAQLDAQRSASLVAQSMVSVRLDERAAAEAEQARAQRIAADATHEAEKRRLNALGAERREAPCAVGS